jgi:hypothetical protein
LLLMASAPAFATETVAYGNVVLTLEPDAEKLSIRITPQLLGVWETYYYTPDDAVQKDMRTMMDELKLLNYTIDEKFWKEHPESGYTIVDTANQAEWMMLAGNHVLYTKYENGEGFAFMHRRYAECEALTAYLEPILSSVLQYTVFDIASLTGITSATLTLADGQTETTTDAAVLAQIESWFSQAQYMRAPSCPNGESMLTLVNGAGESFDLMLAIDLCPYFSVNGVYYDYTPADVRASLEPGTVYPNTFLFECFPGISFTPVNLHP